MTAARGDGAVPSSQRAMYYVTPVVEWAKLRRLKGTAHPTARHLFAVDHMVHPTALKITLKCFNW